MQSQSSNCVSFHPLVLVLALAAAYIVMGHLGLLLAIPPGYATAIWPSSGLALAGVLIYGVRVWPGVWLGSFLVNIGTSFDPTNAAMLLTSVAIPTIIGVGATVQALVGAFLVRRFVGFPTPLDRGREIVIFLLLGAPVGCLVGATVGVTTLVVSGEIPWTMAFIHWATWWGGTHSASLSPHHWC